MGGGIGGLASSVLLSAAIISRVDRTNRKSGGVVGVAWECCVVVVFMKDKNPRSLSHALEL